MRLVLVLWLHARALGFLCLSEDLVGPPTSPTDPTFEAF